MDATNEPIDNSSVPSLGDTCIDKPKEASLNLSELTDQNWLFIKHYLETSDAVKAYHLAGYEGVAKSLPYDMVRRMKPYIEEMLSHSVSRMRLMSDLDRALAIPLIDKERLTVSEWLRLRKFAGTLIPELKENRNISVLVINRHPSDKGTVDMGQGSIPPSTIPISNIIEGEIIDGQSVA